MTLVEFITARLDERQQAAEMCAEVYPAPWDLSDRGHAARVRADAPNFWVVAELEQDPGVTGWLGDRLKHIADNDPAYTLADIAAKRALIDRYKAWAMGTEDGNTVTAILLGVVQTLASVYSDHLDYREEWRP